MAVDSHDFIYLPVNDGRSISKYDTSGNLITNFGSFSGVSGLCFDSQGRMYISEGWINSLGPSHKVHIYDANLNEINSFRVPVPNDFHAIPPVNGYWESVIRPNSLAVNNKGEIFLADNRNDKINVFDFNGNLLKTYGGSNSVIQFQFIWGISIASDQSLRVLDNSNALDYPETSRLRTIDDVTSQI
jgi:sugar lactone lactonase YvrE